MPRTATRRSKAATSSGYSGTITTTGRSEAIRLDKSLFKSHPEFRQKRKVQAHVIGHGMLLISVAGGDSNESKADPVMAAFLSFLDREIAQSPERIRPLSATRIEQARELTQGVDASDEESLPDDVTL